jgi:hypothetical protein
MATAIEDNTGLKAQLIEGHNGIFLVNVNGQTIYDNRGACGKLPVIEDILISLQVYLSSSSSKILKNKMQSYITDKKSSTDC